MGKVHDELVLANFNKTQDYHKDTFVMPIDIKNRLKAYVEFYKIQTELNT